MLNLRASSVIDYGGVELMNRAGNERFQETEKALTDAFLELLEEKELSEITVSELCRRCGIHRSSFYLHFADIYAMMERIEEDLADYYGKLFGTGGEVYDLADRFIRFFSFIESHKSFYKVYWFRSSDLRVLNAVLKDENREAMRQTAKKMGIEDEEALAYHQTFFKAGLAALIGQWLIRDCRETPDEILQILRKEYKGRNI
jgi:AcrR family transcriptional regulator